MTTPNQNSTLPELLTESLRDHGISNDAPDQYEVSFFGCRDKCDPLNEFAIMTAEATVNGVECGWIVKTQTRNRQATGDTIERLLHGLADEIVDNPNHNIAVADRTPARCV